MKPPLGLRILSSFPTKRWVLCAAAAIGVSAGQDPRSAFAQPPPPGSAISGTSTDEANGGRKRTLADLLLGQRATAWLDPPREAPPPPDVDDALVSAHGIRRLEGEYVTVYTDLPMSVEVDELPLVFDRAVPLWAGYFEVPPPPAASWQVRAYVIQDKTRFRATRLFPDDLPPFLHGYQRGYELWIFDQPSDYYRRHLLLHEGVHAFMRNVLGGTGPPWYREGIAELLATHRWRGGSLLVGHMPQAREEVPAWGRIKTIQDAFHERQALRIRDVINYDSSAFALDQSYAWCWAVAAFLDGHPSYSGRFRQLRGRVTDESDQFTRYFEELVAAQARELDEQWQLFVVNIDYGYDFARLAVSYGAGLPLVTEGTVVSIAVDRGWQSSGARLEAGGEYEITASGRFQIRAGSSPWPCEPGGVTLRYYQGLPLGILLGGVRPDELQPGVTQLAQPIPLGLARRVIPRHSGTLYLRINDAPGELADNRGEVSVTIRKAKSSAE
jgi:hypothetical protein